MSAQGGLDRTLDALADPTRRRIVDLLRAGPSSVTALAAQLPVSRPAVSQHLKILTAARLTTATPHGRERRYALDGTGLEPLRRYLDTYWTDVLDAFAQAAAAEADTTLPQEAPR